MPKFLFTGSYTHEGARGVLAEGGTARREATARLVASLGGAVEAYYFAFGRTDFYFIADLPDNAAAAAVPLTAAASGAVVTRTVVLIIARGTRRCDEAVADLPCARRVASE